MIDWPALDANLFWSGEIENAAGWQRGVITIHDHWLSEKEAGARWMSFHDVKDRTDSPDWPAFLEKEQAFIKLFKRLRQEHQLTLWQSDPSRDIPESQPARACKQNVREQQFDLFKSDPLRLIILGNYDLSFPVYIDQKSDTSWANLKHATASSGLYLLS